LLRKRLAAIAWPARALGMAAPGIECREIGPPFRRHGP